jgi:hypothetical protein
MKKDTDNNSREMDLKKCSLYITIIVNSLLKKNNHKNVSKNSIFLAVEKNYEEICEPIWLNIPPSNGPKTRKITITTTAMNTKISAYSIKPCPLIFEIVII